MRLASFDIHPTGEPILKLLPETEAETTLLRLVPRGTRSVTLELTVVQGPGPRGAKQVFLVVDVQRPKKAK